MESETTQGVHVIVFENGKCMLVKELRQKVHQLLTWEAQVNAKLIAAAIVFLAQAGTALAQDMPFSCSKYDTGELDITVSGVVVKGDLGRSYADVKVSPGDVLYKGQSFRLTPTDYERMVEAYLIDPLVQNLKYKIKFDVGVCGMLIERHSLQLGQWKVGPWTRFCDLPRHNEGPNRATCGALR